MLTKAPERSLEDEVQRILEWLKAQGADEWCDHQAVACAVRQEDSLNLLAQSAALAL